MEYLEPYTLALNKHEVDQLKDESRKEKRCPSLHDIVQTKFPINYCFEYISSGFILCYSERFMNTITLYENCFRNNPQKFNGGDSISIIKALYDSSKYHNCIVEYDKYLCTEACCYVVKTQNDTFGDVLRIDLFRMHKIKEDGKYEFIGGLFHCLKHFSIENNNLCNNKETNNTYDIRHIVYLIGHTFSNKSNKENKTEISIDQNHIYYAKFYYEKCSNVYFLETLTKKRIKKH